ncbi:MAG TPA: hypothetical protein VFB95_01365 [Candidatus Cryosericum sp.]|nr:hypothetical protein [Candidatus Cryosericum sp.]
MSLDRLARLGFVLVLSLAAASPAGAATSFDFLFSMDRVHNDNQYFLNLAVSNFGYQRPALEPLLPRVPYVEADLPVLFFLQHASGWPLPNLVDLRAQRASWSVIFTRVGVPLDVLFVGIPDDPGPPYGNAWGYWKKNPRGARLRDRDVCDLVQVQLASRWIGAPAYEVVRGYPRGVTAPVFVADKKGRPYHAQQGKHGEGKQGGGHGPKKGHGKPKSH